MGLSSVVKHSHDNGTIKIKDGTATAKVVTLRHDMANFAAEGFAEAMREIVAYISRGKLVSLRRAAPKWVTGSFGIMVTDLSEDTAGTASDMIHGKGAFASRVSTTTAIGDAVTFDIEWTMEGNSYGDGADHVLLLEDCAIEWGIGEGEPNSCSFSFTCYGNISVNGSVYITAPRVS